MQKYNFNNYKIKIGSRRSPLAVWQAQAAMKRLGKNTELIKISTSGDKKLNKKLAEYGGKGLFTKELEEALEKRKIDIAVHSLKDIPTFIEKKYKLSYILPREDSHDVLLSNSNSTNIKNLESNQTVGTDSPRRIAQIRRLNSNLKIAQMRGNVETRIRKMKEGEVDAIVIALAGVKRLNIKESYYVLDPMEMMPSAGQGIIALQSLKNNLKINKFLANLEDLKVKHQAEAERSVLKSLKGDCNSAISILSNLTFKKLFLTARVYSSDGKKMIESTHADQMNKSKEIGENVGKILIKKGGLRILKL